MDYRSLAGILIQTKQAENIFDLIKETGVKRRYRKALIVAAFQESLAHD